jgi:hypothetical protein
MERAAECRLRPELLEQRLEALMNVVPLIRNKRSVERASKDPDRPMTLQLVLFRIRRQITSPDSQHLEAETGSR